jgi:hypothetical protein
MPETLPAAKTAGLSMTLSWSGQRPRSRAGYAADRPLGLREGVTAEDLRAPIEGHHV